MTKKELKIVYELRDIISKMNWNECHDHNNPDRATIRKELYERGIKLASEITDKHPALKPSITN